jgi:hypothetical protein
MKGFLLAGLGLMFACLVTPVQGQEVHWRPAAPAEAAVTLGRPTAAPATDTAVRPAAFTPEADSAPRLLIRAAGSDVQKPLPQGPAIEGGPEPLPSPKAVTPTPKDTTTDQWGGVFPPGGTPSAIGLGPDEAVDCGPCPDTCGLDCCDNRCPCPECGVFCPNCCCPCQLPRFWASAEYLFWTVKSANLPPLVTHNTLSAAEETALLNGAPGQFTPGGLGQPGTQILFGGNNLDLGLFSGGRFTLGVSGPGQQLGFETTYFFLGQQSQNFVAASSGTPSLFRPFFNATPNSPANPFPTTTAGFVNLQPASNAEIVAIAPFVHGSVAVNYQSQLWGAEANLRYPLFCGCNYKVDVLGGFRYLDLSESLTINESLTFSPAIATVPPNGPALVGVSNFLQDGFATHNHYYGGQIGFDYEHRLGRWIFGVMPKVALGSMHQEVNILGFTTITTPGGGSTTAPGGLLAAGTNIGHHSDDRFAVVPEIGLKIGYQLTDHLKIYAGYDFLYISSVVRPGDQVDLNVNLAQPTILGGHGLASKVTGPAVPAVLFRRTDFWAQGGNVGLEFTW